MLTHIQKTTAFRWILEKWYLVLMCLILALRVFFWFSPSHAEMINLIYLWPAVITAAALQIRNRSALLPKGFALTAGFLLWLLISCVVNGDPYLVYNRTFILYMFICLINFFLVVPTAKDGGYRATFHPLAATYCALMLFLALLGLYVASTGNPLYTKFSDSAIRVPYDRLYFFQYHPNEAASAFTIGLFLFLYFTLESRRILAKAAFVLFAFLLGVVIALTGSRTSIMIASAGVGVFAFWIVYTLLIKRPFWLRWSAGIAALGVVGLLFYQTIILSIDVVASITTSVRAASEQTVSTEEARAGTAEEEQAKPAEEEQAKPAEPAKEEQAKPAEEDQVEPGKQYPIVEMNDYRKELVDIGTLNSRLLIWQSGVDFLKSHPKAFLFGVPDNVVSRIPSTVGRPESHMHNAYLETLLLGGVPGLLMYLAYLGLVLSSCWRLAFHKASSLPYRFLAMIPLFIAVNGITEIYPLFSGNVMDMVSFAISGMVVAVAGGLRAEEKPGRGQGPRKRGILPH